MSASTGRGRDKSSLLMMALTFISRLLGILRGRVLALCFGAGWMADAINFTYNIPNNLRKIFAEGSLSASYIPLFSRSAEDREHSLKLYRQLVSFLLVIFAVLVLATIFLGRQVVGLLSGFEGEALDASSRLLPWFMVFLSLTSLSCLCASVLQARGRFLASAASPIAYTLSVIILLPLMTRRSSYMAMAMATVIGAVAQLLVVWVPARMAGFSFRFDFHWRSGDFPTMISHWLPASLAALSAVITQAFSLYLASGLEEGSVTALSNAIVFQQAPYGIFHASILAVFFPLFAKEEDGRGLLGEAMVRLMAFLVPSAIILMAMGEECIASLLQDGAFTQVDTARTAAVLTWLAVAMPFSSLSALAGRYLNACDRYSAALVVSVVSAVVDMASSYFLSIGYGVRGLAMAQGLSSLAGLLVALGFIGRGSWLLDTARRLGHVLLADIPLLLLALGYMKWNPRYSEAGSTLPVLLTTCALGLVFVLVTVLSYLVFRVGFLRRKPSKST